MLIKKIKNNFHEQLDALFGKEVGFKMFYLETLSFMTSAQKLYKRIGFENIDGPLGNTGHNSCRVCMTKKYKL